MQDESPDGWDSPEKEGEALGVWGVGIFDSDEALDVRDTFTDLIGQGQDPGDASAAIIGQFCYGQPDDYDNNRIILALASTEHSLGIPDGDTFQWALRIIEAPEELASWSDDLVAARRKSLQALRKKLLEDLPPRKQVKPRKSKDTPWEVGQHLLYVEETTGSRLLLRVIGHQQDDGGRYPRFTVLEWSGEESELEQAHLLHPVRQHISIFRRRIYVGALVVGGRVKKSNLIELPPRAVVESDDEYGANIMLWRDLVDHVRSMALKTPPTLV
ncbi:hypothetical protein [Arthrobacter zhaoguopingii]|uniref:hypothetical protein n=1 Tax=Arthrobacter zhaoguopingii TaxID=2681491 RepID=UPI001359BB2D|nr:hypothetical protein [Arthrobacter zhaoguopingii]